MASEITVTMSEFARSCCVSAAAVNKSSRTKRLQAAMVGRRVNITHPDAIAYRQNQATPEAIEHRRKSSTRKGGKDGRSNPTHRAGRGAKRDAAKGGPPPKGSPLEADTDTDTDTDAAPPAVTGTDTRTPPEWDAPPEGLEALPEDIRKLANLTLRDLVTRFGTDTRLVDWLKAVKSIEDIHASRIKNAKAEGDLVARDIIKVGVIEPVDTALVKMLTDGAKTITRRVTAMHGAGRDIDDCETYVRETLESFIKPMKAKVARTLEGLGA